MTVIRIDLRFADIWYELWGLRHFLERLEPQVEALRQEYSGEVDRRLERDPASLSELRDELAEVTEHVLPRLLRNPFIVSTWGAYEGGVSEVARLLAEQRGLTLRLANIRADGFLSQARLYFDSVLNFPLDTSPDRLGQLEVLLILRNAIAHGGGRRGAVNPGVWKRLEQLAATGTGVTISRDFLIVGSALTRSAVEAVDASLNDLIRRCGGN